MQRPSPGHGFHHRVCQLTRLVRMLAVTADGARSSWALSSFSVRLTVGVG